MKKIVITVLLLLSLTGCGIFGKGQTTGFVYAVDDGILWDKVWYKSSLESSESDCYLIKDDSLKQQLRELPVNTRLKLDYDRHIITLSLCSGEMKTDEIKSFEVIK